MNMKCYIWNLRQLLIYHPHHPYPHHNHQGKQTTLIPLTLFLSQHLSLLVVSLDSIQCLHRANKIFLLVNQHWCVKYVGVHQRTSLMSLFLLTQQYLACHVHLTGIVCEMGGKWPYSCRFEVCFFQNLFKTADSFLVCFHLFFWFANF